MEDFRRALATGPVVYKIVHAVEKIQLSINSEKAKFSVSIQSICSFFKYKLMHSTAK